MVVAILLFLIKTTAYLHSVTTLRGNLVKALLKLSHFTFRSRFSFSLKKWLLGLQLDTNIQGLSQLKVTYILGVETNVVNFLRETKLT